MSQISKQDCPGELAGLVCEMLGIFEKVEVSDTNEREFHPTIISSCRVMDSERLQVIFTRMHQLVDANDLRLETNS